MNRISKLIDSLTIGEQWIFKIASLCVIFGSIGIIWIALSFVTVRAPELGGTYSEGMVGYPTAPNPLLAITTTDRSLSKLVYSGLLKKVSWNDYQSELADCAFSVDGLIITCRLNPDGRFHNGKSITARDVVFTYETVQKIGDRSPVYTSLVGVTVTESSETDVQFTLPKPFPDFKETLTLGILPESIWKDVAVSDMESQSTLDKMMIGSGPFRISSQSSSRDHINRTTLKSFSDYIGGRPYLSKINLYYYDDVDALVKSYNKKNIDGFVLESKDAKLVSEIKRNYERTLIVHPDIYGIFTKQSLTQEREVLSNISPFVKTVEIADYGFPWDKPIPPFNKQELLDFSNNRDTIPDIGIAEPKTSVSGTAQEVENTNILVTLDQGILVPLTQHVFNGISAYGMNTEMRIFDFSGFKNTIIPKREFNFLVFGQRYRHISDAYSYWHSQEKSDPGLNVTETVNQKIDSYTESLTRSSVLTAEERQSTFDKLSAEISKENVFLPLYLNRDIYILAKNNSPIHGNLIYNPTPDRFNNIATWYLHTQMKFK